MKVYYWSPFITEVATTYAVINSIQSIHKFSKNKKINCKVIDVFKEWSPYKEVLRENSIETIDLNINLDIKKLPTRGFIKSRFTYILLFFFSILKLHKKIKKEEPDYLIIHLISYIPLFLLNIFDYKTKFILRISGFPKITFLRKYLWKISNKKIYKIFCPTLNTKFKLINDNIFSKSKVHLVRDPVIDLNKTNIKRNHKLPLEYSWLKDKKFVLSIGRLSKQKNYKFLINNFKKIIEKKSDLNLVILGHGEDKYILEKLIKKKELSNKVFLLGYQKNIYPFIENSLFFVLTSDWEDPGFVILESMFSRKIILSSNCESGPKEIIINNKNGFLYETRDDNDFLDKFFKVLNFIEDIKQKKKIIFYGLLTCKKFSQFGHFQQIKKFLV